MWDAVGRVDDGLGGLAARRRKAPFQTIAVDGETGSRLARSGGEKRMCRKGNEQGRVVVKRIVGGGEAADAQPRGERR